jgi:hypothetical protein
MLVLVVGFHFRRRLLLLWPITAFSVVAILFQATYLVLWAIKPMSWIADAWWANLIGFMTWDRFLFHLLFYYFLFYIIYWFAVYWGVLLQSSVLEISLCHLFLGYTTCSTYCCFTWYIREDTFSEYMARFILGPFNINGQTFRFVSSLFWPLLFIFSFAFDLYVLTFYYSVCKFSIWNVWFSHDCLSMNIKRHPIISCCIS